MYPNVFAPGYFFSKSLNKNIIDIQPQVTKIQRNCKQYIYVVRRASQQQLEKQQIKHYDFI